MKQGEIVTSENHFCHLLPDEIKEPLPILTSFVEDFSMTAIRKMMTTMTDICMTTENVFYGSAGTREDLLYVTGRIKQFFEAAFCYLSKGQDAKLIAPDFGTEKPKVPIKLLRVLQRVYFKSSPSGPITFPWINLSGKWLTQAGFSPGDEVALSYEHQKILITMSKEWDIGSNDFKRRA